MQKIEIIIDEDNEMLSINIDNENVFCGNYWDFKRPKDLIDIMKKIKSINLLIKKEVMEG